MLDALQRAIGSGEHRAMPWDDNMGNGVDVITTADTWTTNSGSGIDLSPDAIYASQPAVRTVTSFRALNLSQVPLHSFSMNADGSRDRDRTSDLARFLEQPAPGVTWFSFMHSLSLDRDLWGRYAAVVRYVDGFGWAAYRLPPRTWKFKRNGYDAPVSINPTNWVDGTGALSLEQCLWFDSYPSTERSPMDCLKDALIEEGESSAMRRDLWRNMARIPHWISRPATARPWAPAARANFKESWEAFRAKGGKSGKTPVLEDGMVVNELTQMSPVDAQQIEYRLATRREVAAFWHTPSVLVGDADGTNYNNIDGFRELLYNDTLGADFADISQGFNTRLVPRLAPAGDEFVEFMVAEKLRMSFAKQADIYHKALGGVPYMTMNEVRKMQNMPPVEGGDEIIVPINIKPPDNPINANE